VLCACAAARATSNVQRSRMDPILVIAAIVVILVLVAAGAIWAYRQRRKHLTEKYGDEQIARRMMKGVIWQGETREQLLESLGKPVDIDEKVLKTKSKEIWKYRKTARNRFGLKITLDDGVVVAWEKND
jgi:hypothetical protein